MKRALKNQKGFTLIEIIAVLVILGILAAVAIPRFINLQDDAKRKAIDGALAAGGSNASMLFAQSILTSGGTVPTMASLAATLDGSTNYTRVGDFDVSYATAGTTGIRVLVTAGPPAHTTAYVTGITEENRRKDFTLLP